MIYDHLPLPDGWHWKRLKYLASYNDETLTETTDPAYEFQYIEISDVSLASGISGTTLMSFAEAPSRARRVIQKGDILVSTVRTYLKAISSVIDNRKDLIASTGFCVIRAKDCIDPDYLSWVIKSDVFVDEVVSQSVGVSYPAINAPTLMDIKIPVPNFEIQSRISEFLNERINRVDELAGKVDSRAGSDFLSGLHREISSYRSSLLFHAVLGRIEGLR